MSAKPRDLCTAAFHGDVERLRQLVVAAGVYTGRWQPPCTVDTSPAARETVEADFADINDDDDENSNNNNDNNDNDIDDADSAKFASRPPTYDILTEEAGEEMAEVLGDAEVQLLLAHPEMVRVMAAYALDGADGDDDGAEDDGDGAADGNENELFEEAEEEAAEADRQAQQHDFLIYRCVLAQQRHRESLGQRLCQHGLVQASTTPPVNMTAYGILFSCRATDAADGAQEGEDSSMAGVSDGATAPVTSLQVRWQPSKRSRYAGTLLHWAVLARAHAAVAFLIQHGADETVGLKHLAQMEEMDSSSSSSSSTASMKVLAQLTPACMAAANESLPTLRVLEAAVAARDVARDDVAAFLVALEGRMQRRKLRYVQRRQMAVARRALRARLQREEDERAAAAEGEEGAVEEEDEEEDN